MKKKTIQKIKKSIKEYRKFHERKYPKHYLLSLFILCKLKYIFDYDKFDIEIFFNGYSTYVFMKPYDIKIFVDYEYLSTVMLSIYYTDGITRANIYSYKEFKNKFNEILKEIDNDMIVKGGND